MCVCVRSSTLRECPSRADAGPREAGTRTSISSRFVKTPKGLYVGFEHYIPIDGDPHAVAIGSGVNTRAGCRRIAEFAFNYAVRHGRKKVTIVHKANILKALTGVFLETAREVGKGLRRPREDRKIALWMPAPCSSF